MTDRNLDSVIELLRSVGAKGCLNADDRLALVRKDRINRRGKGFWKPIAEKLSKPDLENLFRGLVIVERELNWMGGSGASAIWVFLVYQKRFEDASIELANWALTNRGRNSYIPFGGRTDVNSYDEWIAEKKLRRQRITEHGRHQLFQQEEKIIRREKRLECYKARLHDGKVRAKLVKEYNKSLSLVDIGERLKLIAHSDMPLESVDSELLDEVLCDSPSLNTKTINILLEKIDRRDRGSWRMIKRALLSRSTVGGRSKISVIPKELIDAYHETHFRVLEPVAFVLRIGEPSQVLEDLYRDRSVSSSAFLTAYNPYSNETEVVDNEKANDALKRALKDEQIIFYEGIGEDPAGEWSGEPSVFALDLSREKAISIGRAFNQNSIVWIGSDAVPELVLLR
jgi:hypothetical protein